MSDAYALRDVDYAALPTAMLDLAKKHMRVDFTDDDEYITGCLARAIQLFEYKSGQHIFSAQADWHPEASDGPIICPVQPVADFIATDADAADVSDAYAVTSTGSATAPVMFSTVDGSPIPAGLDVVLAIGFEDVDTMPPAVTDSVLRIAAMLYDQRESVAAPMDQVPSWWDDLLVGQWIPRC